MGRFVVRKIRSWSLSFPILAVGVFAAMVWFAPAAYGWGGGHNTQAKMVVDGLPEEIKDFLGEQNCKDIIGGPNAYCGFPDAPRMKEELLGKEALAEFKRMKLDAGSLHSSYNAAVAFDLLCMAFAEKNPKHAAVWVGALTHTIGDNTAHLALTAYVGAFGPFKFNPKMANGYGDLSAIDQTGFGRNKVKELMGSYKPQMIADNPEDALFNLIVNSCEMQDYGDQKEARLAGTYNPLGEKETISEDSVAAMAELGAHGSQKILDAVVTAWEFAKRKKTVALNAELMKKGDVKIEEYCNAKPLASDTVYDGTLDSNPSGSAVGVLLENSTVMGFARFGYTGCVYLAQTMRCFKEASVPYLPLDIRKVEKDGLPSPDKMPALVLSSGGYEWQGRPFITKYIKDGGKVIWIGGRDKGLLGKLSASLKPADTKLLPVGMDYEDSKHEGAAAVARVSVKFLDEFAKQLGSEPLKFVNNPNTSGWTTPHCDLQIVSDDADIKMLAAVTDGKDTMNIAAALMENGKARHVFLPMYLLLPYILTTDKPKDFAKMTFDSLGKKVMLTSVKMLVPDLMPKEK